MIIDFYDSEGEWSDKAALLDGFIDSRICGFLRFAKDAAQRNTAKTLKELKNEYIFENMDLLLDYIADQIKANIAESKGG